MVVVWTEVDAFSLSVLSHTPTHSRSISYRVSRQALQTLCIFLVERKRSLSVQSSGSESCIYV